MAQKIDLYSNEPIVIIKPQAYLKMLKHVLLYGNEFCDSSVEVMGICYGKDEDKKLVQYDAVPISHGGAIEVEFSTEDYAAFAMADEQMAEKGYYAIGWYHSHPGLKAFFSKVDVKNHLFYQKEQTPFAYGIVFDHMYFSQGDESVKYGFKAFRLNDYKKGVSSDFHDIKYEVELPDDLSYYTEINSIIEAIQKKKPIILEARESMEGLGEWTEEGTVEEEEKPEEKDPFKEVKQGYHEGNKSFSTVFMDPMMTTFQDFTKDTQNAALKGSTVMIEALEEMRDSIGSGLERVKGYFEKNLEKEIKDVNASIEKQIKTYAQKEEEIPQKLQSMMDNVSNSLTETIGSSLEKSLEGIITNMKKVAFTAQKIAQQQEAFKSAVEKQEATLKTFPESVQKNTNELNNAIGNLPKNVNGLISKRVDSVKVSVNDLKEISKEIKATTEELSKMVMAKRK